MALVNFWKSSETEFRKKSIKQIIAIAGEGKLTDSGECSKEFREFLSFVPSEFLRKYVDSCLTEKFEDGGFALQDLVNEVGRRLGFEVTHGRYRGVQGQLGFDGLWKDEDGHTLIVEVKTTDAYRINLDTASGYRTGLIAQQKLTNGDSSILIAVGRQDTGDLEAQIRGSRHSWDIRLISVDALLRLLAVREETEDPAIQSKIAEILRPREYTRLDEVVDLVFAAAEDIQSQQIAPEQQGESVLKERTARSKAERDEEPSNFHDGCIDRIAKHFARPFVKKSRSIYGTPDGEILISCSVSKEYSDASDHTGYWYAFHPHQAEQLKKAKSAFVAFGLGSAAQIIMMPFAVFEPLLEGMGRTEQKGRFYWHVLIRNYVGKYLLQQRKGIERVDISKYLLS